jgi:hypothetical protein
MAAHGQPVRHGRKRAVGQVGRAFLPALAAHQQRAGLRVHIARLEPRDFRPSQTRPVQHGEQSGKVNVHRADVLVSLGQHCPDRRRVLEVQLVPREADTRPTWSARGWATPSPWRPSTTCRSLMSTSPGRRSRSPKRCKKRCSTQPNRGAGQRRPLGPIPGERRKALPHKTMQPPAVTGGYGKWAILDLNQ